MGRRSDHSRQELGALILEQAHRQMAEVGFARFSAREVAKRIGYTIGTIYNVYGTLDRLLAAVNARTFGLWADSLAMALDRSGEDRIATLVAGYFRFAHDHRNLWNAIYDHHLPIGEPVDEAQLRARGRLIGIVADEVDKVLPPARRSEVGAITRSLIAIVHGHCALDLAGSYALLGGTDACADALARVREIIAFGDVEPATARRT
jgi:AcrR family transcriptional regulator